MTSLGRRSSLNYISSIITTLLFAPVYALATSVSPTCANLFEPTQVGSSLGSFETNETNLAILRAHIALMRSERDLQISNQETDYFTTGEALLAKIMEAETTKQTDHLKKAWFYHGTTSQSLFAFTTAETIGLVPNPVFEILAGGVPLAGELYFGNSKKGVNRIGISVVPWPLAYLALRYATKPTHGAEYNVAELRKEALLGPADYIQIQSARIQTLERRAQSIATIAEMPLSEIETSIVREPFGVVFGFRPQEPKNFLTIDSPFDKSSSLIVDKLSARDISVVFVPRDKIELVRSILLKSGASSIEVGDIRHFELEIDESEKSSCNPSRFVVLRLRSLALKS